MLLFVASIVALKSTVYNENQQRIRNFVSAKAFLPEALSELCTYFKLSALLLKESWNAANNISTTTPLQIPELPASYRDTFKRCICFAEPDVAQYLAYLLASLQVHDARIKQIYYVLINNQSTVLSQGNCSSLNCYNIITHLYRLAELQALVNRLFEFARNIEVFDSSDLANLEKFDSSDLAWEDYENAYSNLDIEYEDIDASGDPKKMELISLEKFTKRAIERKFNKQKK